MIACLRNKGKAVALVAVHSGVEEGGQQSKIEMEGERERETNRITNC